MSRSNTDFGAREAPRFALHRVGRAAFQRWYSAPELGDAMRWLALTLLLTLVVACRNASLAPPDVPRVVVCAGRPCLASQICCFANGRCIDRDAPSSECGPDSRVSFSDASTVDDATVDSWDAPFVAVPGEPPPAQGGGSPCFSNRDCAADEYCHATLCLGPGSCVRRTDCATCSTGAPVESPGGPCQVCGCDGRAYPSTQDACGAAVRSVFMGSCGRPILGSSEGGVPPHARIPCGNDAHCPSTQWCCPILGMCVDRDCDTCCRFPPAGTTWPCRDNFDCTDGQICDGIGCGTPGGCVNKPAPIECMGPIDPVCGCNGRSYMNPCSAHQEGVRVAHPVACN